MVQFDCKKLRYSFGPRSFKKDISKYFLNYGGEFGDKWDALNIPLLNAVLDKKKVESFDVNYEHPPQQTEFEKSNLNYNLKRIAQLNNIVSSLHSQFKIRGNNIL